MSPWAPEPQAPRESGEAFIDRRKTEPAPFELERRMPVWARIAPLFSSALFFWSAIFSVLSPFPILLAGLANSKRARAWVYGASVTNSALVFALGGREGLMAFLVFSVAPAIALFEALIRGKRIEFSATAALAAMLATGGAAILYYSHFLNIHPWAELKNTLSEFVDHWMKSAALPQQDPAELENWKNEILVELPSAIGVIALVVVWANLMLALRLNPKGVRSKLGLDSEFFSLWKTPEWLIWPTIFSGATLLFNAGLASDLGRNIFKFLMAIYAFQGISILSFFFSRWQLRGPLRFLGYLMAIVVTLPLLLSLGFFDVWFDFRGRFRQS